MNLKIWGLIFIISASLLSGCAQPKPLYNYSDYNENYYHYKKDMSEETTLKLQKSIEDTISKAGESQSGRVPPGMYANLGYIYLKSGNPNEAVANFEKEKVTYPESAHFMDRIIAKVELAEGASK